MRLLRRKACLPLRLLGRWFPYRCIGLWLLSHLNTLSSTLDRNQCWILPQDLCRTRAEIRWDDREGSTRSWSAVTLHNVEENIVQILDMECRHPMEWNG